MASKKQKDGEEAAFPFEALPSDVQSSVLGRLPLRSLFRSKCVCKLWNDTISAPSFTHYPSRLQYPATGANPPWLILKSADSLLAFDFEALSWFKFEVRFLFSKLKSMHASAGNRYEGRVGWCTSSASGLLLLRFCSSLYVCNPLTKSVFRLPPFKSIVDPFAQCCFSTRIRTDDAEGSFANTRSENNILQGLSTAVYTRNHISTSLFMGNSTGNAEGADCSIRNHRLTNDYILISIGMAKTNQLAIEAYCANTNSWNVVGSVPRYIMIKTDEMLECNGLLYSLLFEPIGMLVVGESDGKGGPIWRIQAMPAGIYCLHMARLVVCRNAIFMVCLVDEFNNGLSIWQFQPDSRAWIKMKNTPDYIFQDLKSASSSHWVDCVGVGNFICIRAFSSLRVLTYNPCDDVWSWLPEPVHAYDSIFARTAWVCGKNMQHTQWLAEVTKMWALRRKHNGKDLASPHGLIMTNFSPTYRRGINVS